MNAVIYARYSSDNQREESIEGQMRECMAYAEKNGIKVIDSYIDRAFSAKTDQRPAFQKMIKDSAKKLFDTVLVWKLDRFARDRYDSARYKNTLKKNGVKVISAMERISDGPEGIILESVLEGMAEYYSADLAEKVIRGHTENALKCKCNGGTIAFGLMVDEEQCYVPNPMTAPIVLEIYQMYDQGKTMKEIVDDLDRRKIRGVHGNKIGLDTLNRILSNRKYIGEYKYRDIVVPDGIPAIVPKDLFDRVQELKAKNKKAPARRKAEDLYLLATKLFCGRCGTPMDGECGHSCTGKRYSYYKCNNAKKKQGCTKKAVRKQWIEDLVVQETMFKLNNDAVIDQIADAVIAYQGSENTTLPLLRSQLKEVEKGIENLLNAVQAGMFHPSMKKRLDDLEAQKGEIETRILQEQISKPVYTREQVVFWLKRFRYLDMTVQEQRQRLIDCFIKAIYLFDDKLLLTFNYSDDERNVSIPAAERKAVCSDLTSVGGPLKRLISKEMSRFSWRRIGMIKPPVQLGVNKNDLSIQEEPPMLK